MLERLLRPAQPHGDLRQPDLDMTNRTDLANTFLRPASLCVLAICCAWTVCSAQRTLEVAPATMNAIDPDLTSDGRLVSFLSGGQVYLARPDGSALTALPVLSMTNQSISVGGGSIGPCKVREPHAGI